jgi:hypothetical protein
LLGSVDVECNKEIVHLELRSVAQSWWLVGISFSPP